MAHQNIKQLFKTINAIYDPWNVYLLHIDVKAGESYKQMVEQAFANFGNIRIMASRDIAWGAWTQVDIQLEAIIELLSQCDWDYFVNMSGLDYPLKSQAYIKEYLRVHPSNYIHVVDEPEGHRYAAERFRYDLDEEGNLIRGEEKPMFAESFPGMQSHFGSGWFILTRSFCEYLVTHEQPKRIADYYKHCLMSDESYFQTVMMNSGDRFPHFKHNLRYIVMTHTGQFILNAAVLDPSHEENMMSSGLLFARKVDCTLYPEMVDRIDRVLFAR
ncbi:beta-1,6-N-acetylglucosaminyltransferase [Cohnella sp. REN36]|nr:beta-1,6-N-acetylglucosaminyltransferase [Cohnella sp. REN36]